MTTTDLINKNKTLNFTKLIAEWDKPKSLAEIYAFVGKFPFRAKAVEDVEKMISGDHFVIPVGTTPRFSHWDTRAFGADRVICDYVQGDTVGSAVYAHHKRWLLVED